MPESLRLGHWTPRLHGHDTQSGYYFGLVKEINNGGSSAALPKRGVSERGHCHSMSTK